MKFSAPRVAGRSLLLLMAVLFSTATLAQDQGFLYRISLDANSSDFSRYDIATDTWTTLTPFPSRAQMATSPDGRLFGWNTSAGEIQQYNPVGDTWSFVQAAPPVSPDFSNLEYRANGEWIYTDFGSSTLHYTVGGAWQTLALPFNANAIGDYDPATDTLVIGQANTNFFHAIDMGTLAITSFTTDASSQGEYSRCGQIRNGRFYYQTSNHPLRYLDLSDNTAAPTDVVNLFGFYDSCAVSENENLLFGGTLDGTQLTSVLLSNSTTTPLAGHTQVGNHSSLTWVGPSDFEFANTARFLVTKTFDDGNPAEVNVNITCDTGLPLQQDALISQGDPVEFVVESFESGTMDCTITETTLLDGYDTEYDNGTTVSSTSCSFENVVSGAELSCEVINQLQPVDVVIRKDWEFMENVDGIEDEARIGLSCSNVAFGQNDWKWWINGDEANTAKVYPDWDGTTTCSVYERVFSSAVESTGCEGAISVEVGDSPRGCTITNTVFFEGIPTLSQWGMAIMILLMLGVGFVGFRRMA